MTLENKAYLQEQKWIEKWVALENKHRKQEEKEANIDEAERRTLEAIEALKEIDDLLIHTLSIDDTVDWDSIKKSDEFSVCKPSKPLKKRYKEIPPEPDKFSPEFSPKFTLFEKLINPTTTHR